MLFHTSCAALTFALLLMAFNFYLSLFAAYEYIEDTLLPNGQDGDEFDYIIVGCGTAGSLIAHRLSAHSDIEYAVIEAGGHGGPLLNPPAVGPLLQTTRHDWQYETEQIQGACLAMKNKKCRLAAGKIVGGSAKLNNMIHMNNFADEIFQWFSGKYTRDRIAQSIREIETYDLYVESLNFRTNLSSSVLRAASKLGFSVNSISDDNKTGFMEAKLNKKSGSRWSTSHTFLNHHIKNGKLIKNAHVEKILFDDDNVRAIGVSLEKYGKRKKIFARKGIILAAGAIGTPKLLLLSGIGPRDHLTEMNIPVVKSLHVGNNLVDHVTTGLDLILLNETMNMDLENFLNPFNAWNYFYSGTGAWTSSGCEVIAILNTELLNPNSFPDLQLMILPVGLSTDKGIHLKNVVGIADHVWKKYFNTLRNSITILPIVLHPESSGYVKLKNNNPSEVPLINPNYLSNEADIEVILKGIEIVKRLIATEPLKSLGARLNPIVFPGCERIPFDTKQYWICYMRHLTLSVYHPAGTCRMGNSAENTSVVDYDFRVMGVENLFVADASIFPNLPSGNINTAVALVAHIFSQELVRS